jgi:hypothetical protein
MKLRIDILQVNWYLGYFCPHWLGWGGGGGGAVQCRTCGKGTSKGIGEQFLLLEVQAELPSPPKERGVEQTTVACSVADPGSVIRCFIDTWIRDPDSGSGMGKSG